MQRAVLRARGFLEEVYFNLAYRGRTPYAKVSGLEKGPDLADSLMKYRSWCEEALRPGLSWGEGSRARARPGRGEATQSSPYPEFFSSLTPRPLPEASPAPVTLSPSLLRWFGG